jgi:hypothetical protein
VPANQTNPQHHQLVVLGKRFLERGRGEALFARGERLAREPMNHLAKTSRRGRASVIQNSSRKSADHAARRFPVPTNRAGPGRSGGAYHGVVRLHWQAGRRAGGGASRREAAVAARSPASLGAGLCSLAGSLVQLRSPAPLSTGAPRWWSGASCRGNFWYFYYSAEEL